MKRCLCWLLTGLAWFSVGSQITRPLALEDPHMDAHLQHRHPATLRIRIVHAPDTIQKVPVKCSLVTFGSEFQKEEFYEIHADGTLTITLDQNLPYQQIWLQIGSLLYTGVYVNTDLLVTIDVAHIKDKDGLYFTGEGLSYSGRDGALNTVMNQHVVYKQEEHNRLISRLSALSVSRKSYSPANFMSKTDSIEQALQRLDAEFVKQHPDYAWAIYNETASAFYGMVVTAYWGDTLPRGLLEKIIKHRPYFTSNDGVLFYSYLGTYLTARIRGINRDIRQIDSLHVGMKADLLKVSLMNRGKDSFALTYPVILQNLKTAWCRNLVTREWAELNVKQQKIDSLLSAARPLGDTLQWVGTPIAHLPFEANLYTIDNPSNEMDFIRNLQLKFKGKALIIDFWATWCTPCMNDLPHSRKLHEANSDLPIEYVYICTNRLSGVKLWKDRIAGLKIPGTHIFMDDKMVADLKSIFENAGAGFPTYVVVDVHGKLKPKAIQWMEFLDRDKLKTIAGL